MSHVLYIGTNKVDTQSAAVTNPAGTKKRRKIVRRLVDKMYVDEDGSMGKNMFYIMPYC